MRVLSNIHRNSFPFSITRVTHLAIHPFLLSTLSLRHQPFDFARSIVAFMCDHFALDFARLSTSRYQDRLSLEFDPVFFFQFTLSVMLYASCLFIYTIYVSIFETTSHTSNSVVSCNFCDASSPCVSPGSSSLLSISGSGYVSRQRDSQAFMRISIYSGTLCILSTLVEHDARRALFDDDDYEINETIDLCVTFKSQLFRHQFSLNFSQHFLSRS